MSLKLVHSVEPLQQERSVAERIRQSGPLEHLSLSDVVRLMGGSAANGDNQDPVVYPPQVELQMRQVIARYGFERLPLSYGELYGLLEYCDALDAATGVGMFETDAERKAWQGDLSVWRLHRPTLVPAIERYAAGDLEGLRQMHRENDTLTRLGKEFNEFGQGPNPA